MKKIIIALFFIYSKTAIVFAQFAPQAGFAGTTAIHADSAVIINWANNCTLKLGYQNIADTALGLVSVGSKENAIGKADGRIVSLGDGGEAILHFDNLIVNGPGPDFVVFENGFSFDDSLYFLELAFVEVSSNGRDFVRFEPTSLTNTNLQIGAFEGLDAKKINNLAGKYIAPYGTPFDLDELKNNPLIDVNHIKFIKIIDVVGSIDETFGSKDKNNNLINDPWPTPFPSGGFDLDAVGVIHQKYSTSIKKSYLKTINLYPNPVKASSSITITEIDMIDEFVLLNQFGELASYATNFDIIAPEKPGVYFYKIRHKDKESTGKLIVY
ncbi:MAG: T9SS type A sorting domain-containing protein [Bacteroidia bacterium]